jgi:hypothetical protein
MTADRHQKPQGRLEALVRWEFSEHQRQWNLLVQGRSAATVWDNGTWHTWDRQHTGGENSQETTVERAKIEAAASAIAQGFI